ncbi:hypothetical protein QVD17_02230 [Tagetes erecta]|uniref:Thioredoxin domain-containing protein n=1 Tax=Tagetes erecta TaxID=13708 RepID=A0AAD8LF61_TARER|nr:hypothetical protein QVD17_02230 [Tagetes erecta]
MAKCFQMSISAIHQTKSPFCCSTKLLVAPIKPAIITPLPSIRTFKGNGGLIACSYSVNQVEVVTACSWTELVVAADKPVLVEIWAPWRELCQVIDEVAKEYAGKALCYRLNIDDYPNIALQYGIASIPCVIFYKNGENIEIICGGVSKSTLSVTLDKYLD